MRRGLLVGGETAALMLVLTGLAWACTSVTSPTIAVEPNHSRAGVEVTVTGTNWAANTPVDIVWVTSQQKLASPMANGSGGIATRVVIPADAAGGHHYIQGNQPGKQQATTFTVDVVNQNQPGQETKPGETSHISTPGGDGSTPPGVQPAYVPAAPQDEYNNLPAPQPQPGAEPAGTPAPPASTGGPTGNLSGTTPVAPEPAAISSQPPAQQSGGLIDGAQPPSGGGGLNVAPSQPAAGQAPGFDIGGGNTPPQSGSQGSGQSESTPAGNTSLAVVEEQENAPTPLSATADLWSGFSSSGAARTPGLGDLSEATRSELNPLALSTGILSVGLVALAAGFGVAELRRRRVTVAGEVERTPSVD